MCIVGQYIYYKGEKNFYSTPTSKLKSVKYKMYCILYVQ